MKPTATLFFMIAVMGILAILMTVFPQGGISVTKDLTLEFPSLGQWLEEGSPQRGASGGNAYIPDLVEEDKQGGLTEGDTMTVADMSGVPTSDSSVYSFTPRPIAVGGIRQPLELPPSGLGCLRTLFDALVDPDQLSKVVRILHYGDSQIETDRITGYLRYKLQQQFGGSGPGLVPAKTAYDYKSPCQVINEGDWQRYTIFPFIDTNVHHSRYGALASFVRFSPLSGQEPEAHAGDTAALLDTAIIPKIPDYRPADPPQVYHASLQIVPSRSGYYNARTIKKVRMFYGNSKKSFAVRVMDGASVLYADSLKANGNYASRTWNFAQTPEDFRMEFAGEDSPDIYGFAMDGLSGVAVDNIALRGCSGTIFTKMNGAFLGGMYRDLNVKCIILQFGGNAIPSMTPDRVGWFKGAIASQIRYIKRIYPGVSVIVVGPADMSTKVQDRYETYEVLPDVVEGMRSAALQNDCAFWDMYSAMGGMNTMPDWVFHDPPYAEKDFVHFTPNGANAIARMLYNSIIARYNEYIAKK